MSSFRRPELLYPDSGTSVQPVRTIEATTSSLNLPPLRCIDPLQRSTDQHTQGPGLTTQLRSARLPPISQYPPQLAAVTHHNSINSGYSPLNHHGSGTPSAVQMNLLPHPTLLPIAPSDSYRLLSGGRHKKEVKRRTKTGCLTCRKRRIKVGHLSLSFRFG
jgi:white-opaque regulator 2